MDSYTQLQSTQVNYLTGQNYGPPDSWQYGNGGKSQGVGDSNTQVLFFTIYLLSILFKPSSALMKTFQQKFL